MGKNGAQPRVFDSTKSGQGGTGITTAGNLLHQVWEGGFVPTPTANLVVPGSIPQSIDTHFLVNTASLFITQLPAENRPLLAPSLHPFAGYGSFLTGAFALVGPANPTWNFAYIVVPAGTTVHFDFELGAAGFSSETVTAALAVVFAPGDLNMDGVVNIFDLNLVSANWGGIGPAGDVNGDGRVDIFDVNQISNNWSATGGSASAVPEPATLILILLGFLGVACLRRRRRHSRATFPSVAIRGDRQRALLFAAYW